jgi:hypothetical protein
VLTLPAAARELKTRGVCNYQCPGRRRFGGGGGGCGGDCGGGAPRSTTMMGTGGAGVALRCAHQPDSPCAADVKERPTSSLRVRTLQE